MRRQESRMSETESKEMALEMLARTIWGEGRGEGRIGMAAVGHVIMNRVLDKRWPNTVKGVVTQPQQFSAWNQGDPNRIPMLNINQGDPAYIMAREIAEAVWDGTITDPTHGSNHYHTHKVSPAWSKGLAPTEIIGNHRFFRL